VFIRKKENNQNRLDIPGDMGFILLYHSTNILKFKKLFSENCEKPVYDTEKLAPYSNLANQN
jgi:hypothetical protein